MRHRLLLFVISFVFMTWNYMTFYVLSRNGPSQTVPVSLEKKLSAIQRQIQLQVLAHQELLGQLQTEQEAIQRHLRETLGQVDDTGLGGANSGAPTGRAYSSRPSHTTAHIAPINASFVLPVLVFACNRVSIRRNLDQLIKYRPSAARFPIIVTQDCGHAPTARIVQSYGSKVKLITHPDLSNIDLPWTKKKFQGYYKIARHYKWALNQIFHHFKYEAVIIVEDDLDISPDFYEYFASTYPILHADPTLWCVSAWNDNGKAVAVSSDPSLLYRTDFFPGLGWMMEKKLWLELEPKWPTTFWDDWMRHPDQRRDRACIRPEISRTVTFGRIGVSKGQFYDKHLKFIKLNDQYVPFTKRNMTYLMKDVYDAQFIKTVYGAPQVSLTHVMSDFYPSGVSSVRVEYTTKDAFKTMAKQLKIMEDLKSGVPRAGYRGVVSFMRNRKRVYLAPPPSWTKYDRTWN